MCERMSEGRDNSFGGKVGVCRNNIWGVDLANERLARKLDNWGSCFGRDTTITVGKYKISGGVDVFAELGDEFNHMVNMFQKLQIHPQVKQKC